MLKIVIALISCVGLSAALSIGSQQPALNNWLQIFVEEFLQQENDTKAVSPDPPPYYEEARMARYIMHQSDWTSMATFSTRMPGYPTANVFSVSDGTVDKSTGIPYFYLSDLELSMHDLKANNKASITMSLAQGDYCKKLEYDAEDPRCAHLILTGKIVTLDENSDEYTLAKEGLFNRHPEMPTWPASHGWTFRKLDIENIMLLDFFGGVKTPTVEEYLNATPY